MILIESPDGSEKQLVSSTSGYEDWKVLAQDVDCPEDDHEWCKKDKCFKPNEDRIRKRKLRRHMRDPEALMAIIQELQDKVQRLELIVSNQSSKEK